MNVIHVLSDDPDGAELLDNLKRELGNADLQQLNTTVFDGQQLVVEDLIAACEAMPFLASRRLVILRGLLSRVQPDAKSAAQMPASSASEEPPPAAQPKASQLVQQLCEYLPRLPLTTELAFIEPQPIDKQHAVYKTLVQARARFAQTPPLQGEALAAWVERRVAAKGGRIAPGVSALLASYAWNDLRQLDAELDKLVTYSGKQQVDSAAVRQLVEGARETNVFRMTDHLATGEAAAALGLMRDLLAEGEHPLKLLTMIVRQFRLLVQTKDLHGRGLSTDTIATRLRVRTFVVERLMRQLRRYPDFGQLEQVYANLVAADAAAKSGGRDLVVSIELLMADLARPR